MVVLVVEDTAVHMIAIREAALPPLLLPDMVETASKQLSNSVEFMI